MRVYERSETEKRALRDICRRLIPGSLALLLAMSAGAELNRETQAAVILRLIKYVDWPMRSQPRAFVLCVDDSPLVLRALRSRAAADPAVTITSVTANNWGGCQVVVTDTLERRAVEVAPNDPVLTIGMGAEYVDAGGVIGLDLERRRFVFDVNLTEARRRGLEISSALLELARRVR